MRAVLGRIVNDYQGLIEVCRQRAAELAISRSGIDEVSGLPNGMAGKILGDRQVKKMGPLTLGPLLQTLGLKMLIIEDDAATAKTLARRTPVRATSNALGTSRVSRQSCWHLRRRPGRPRLGSFAKDKSAASPSMDSSGVDVLRLRFQVKRSVSPWGRVKARRSWSAGGDRCQRVHRSLPIRGEF